MKKTTSALCCALLVSAASLSTAFAADTDKSMSSPMSEPRSDMPRESGMKHSDKAFFEKAAKCGMKEVSVSQSVLNNLTNPEVKAFAQMIVSDHSGANAELMALASSKGVTLPAKDTTKFSEKWTKKHRELDEEYVEEMVSDHKDAVDLFEKASKSADADVAAFAQKTLPTLQNHLQMAKGLKKSVD